MERKGLRWGSGGTTQTWKIKSEWVALSTNDPVLVARHQGREERKGCEGVRT
jgi:hypothetical protein